MENKVGNSYILPGEIRKRKSSEIAWVTIWIVLIISWSSCFIFKSIETDFWNLPSKDIFAIIFFCSIPMVIFIAGFLLSFKSQEYVRTIEYMIHEYERWDRKNSQYQKLYLTEEVHLMKNFTYYKFTGDSTLKMSPEELREYCERLPGSHCTYVGHKTKEEAMKSILEDIKRLIANEKENQNIKIRNVKTLETFTVDELKEKVENGELENSQENDSKK